jgi:hypothetical protein
METKRYRYSPYHPLTPQKRWGKLVLVLGFLVLVFALHEEPEYNFPLAIVLIADFYYVYSYPDIWVSPEGIEVEFLWFRLPVRWDQVIGIVPGIKPFTLTSSYWVVKVKGLTFFHRLYMFFTTGSLAYPGFVIHEGMENCSALLSDIEKATHKTG